MSRATIVTFLLILSYHAHAQTLNGWDFRKLRLELKRAIFAEASIPFETDSGIDEYRVVPIDSIGQGLIHSMKLRARTNSPLYNFLLDSMRVEILVGRGTTGILRQRFVGINAINESDIFDQINEIAEPGDRIIFDCKPGYVISIPIVTRARVINIYQIFDDALLRNVYYANCTIMMYGVSGYHLKGFVKLNNCKLIYPIFKDGTIEDTVLDSISAPYFSITNCADVRLHINNSNIETFHTAGIEGKHVYATSSHFGEFDLSGMLNDVKIENNSFESGDVGMSGVFKTFLLDNNIYDSVQLDLNRLTVEDRLKMVGNSFGVSSKVSIEDFHFPSSSSEIGWDQLADQKLSANMDAALKSALPLVDKVLDSASNVSDKSIAESLFRRRIRAYQILFNHYKEIGDIASANECYIEKKDIEGARLREKYYARGGFKNYISWRLNTLMKFYTEHGTDPAKAIVISVWVIVCFGIFYFFYPSDWDKSSKGLLIQNYRDLVQKNEKGYVKPFFVLVLGFLVSLINALTLSLNSFVTLGFGNIPTHGAARYLTIVEGFVGWFLLSIFTVALINQVLA